MRTTIPLNHDWLFKPEFEEESTALGAVLSGFSIIEIPHTVKELPYNDFDDAAYQIVSSYVKEFPTPSKADDDRVILSFGAVMTIADVWVNGVFVGRHEGGFTPFEFDVTEHLDASGVNRLFVRVDAHEIDDVPPFGDVVDYLCYGGIYREVELRVRPKLSVRHLFIRTLEPESLAMEEMDLVATIDLSDDVPEGVRIAATLYREGKEVRSFAPETTCEEHRINFTELVTGIVRWNLDDPVLYELEIAVMHDGVELDRVRERFGFRTAAFTEEGFVLNNVKIKLVGLDRHQSWPYVGFAMPARMQRKDAEILKNELGCSIVRTSHYMQSDHFIDRCDELGLLVFEEIPGWQHIGGEHFKELTLANLRTMIETHFNHPSIVLWGVRINESPDDHEFYERTNALAHELDESRQTGGVRNFRGSDLLEDVYTYNDFSHTGENAGLARPRRIMRRIAPYLVTEHNGHIFPTKKFDPETKRTEQGLRHMKVIDAAYGFEDACGAIGWCMNDYNTHAEFGSGDRICYHGVLDMFRIPKYAASVYASQQDRTPILTVASEMTMGDHSLSRLPPTVIFTNCDYVKVSHNGVYVDTFYSAWGEYPNAPHAPIFVDDYYGDQIEQNEGYPKGKARLIRRVLVSFGRYGDRMPLVDRLLAFFLLTFRRFSFAEAESLYRKYVGSVGEDGSSYLFEGYVGDRLVATAVKNPRHRSILTAVPDDAVLVHGDTYDVTRIVVRMQDENGNDLAYANDAFSVTTTAGLAVIGPERQALIGGSIGVYVRTTGTVGPQTVTIRPAGGSELTVSIETK
jgi:beta-galactosidase